jgi:2-iminobutanoate/2-iminopropanoate deaminase
VSKHTIFTPQAPAPIGPYSQAVRCGNLLFLSGQIPLDPATGQVVAGDAAVQTERVLQNLAAILQSAGSSLAQVLKTTVYLRDLGDFAKMNEVFGRFFGDCPPARSTLQAARLPRDVAVEVELVAEVEG